MTDLKQKQRLFAEEYAISGNGRESYRKAGYNAKSNEAADTNASRLLRNAKVRAYINELSERATDEKVATVTEVLQTLTAIVRGQSNEEVLALNPISGEFNRATKRPDQSTVIKAAAEILKRHPVTSSVDITLKNPYEGLTEEELRRLAARSG